MQRQMIENQSGTGPRSRLFGLTTLKRRFNGILKEPPEPSALSLAFFSIPITREPLLLLPNFKQLVAVFTKHQAVVEYFRMGGERFIDSMKTKDLWRF